MRRYLVLGMLCALATTTGPARARNINHNGATSNTGNFIASWETGELGGTVTALSLPDLASCSTGGVSVSKRLGPGGARGTVSSDALGTLANDAVADEASIVEDGARQNGNVN